MDEKLTYLEIDPSSTPVYCVIWLHGLGAMADDFVSIVPQLNLPTDLAVRFVFPQAPMQPVTLNMGYVMPAWYDILGLALDSQQDDPGIRQAQMQLDELINAEIASGIASEHIVLAGFSQGGALALQTALRFPQKLAGVMALSSYLPLADCVAAEKNSENANLPILITHGISDKVLSIVAAEMSSEHLTELGHPVTFKTYPMAHEVCFEEIHDIATWLQQILTLV